MTQNNKILHDVRRWKLKELLAGVPHYQAALAAASALSFHILLTIQFRQTNLRIGFSDFLLPFLALLLLVLWHINRRPPLQWRLPHMWRWLAALSLWMIIALINGRFQAGEWVVWALVNKGVGWLVLISYFILGGAFAQLCEANVRNSFVFFFIAAAVLISSFALIASAFSLNYYHYGAAPDQFKRLIGFAANPNAFAITTAAALILYLPFLERRAFIPGCVGYLFAGILASSVYFTFSRSALLGLIIAICAFWIIRSVSLRTIGITAATAALISMLVILTPRFFPSDVVYPKGSGQEHIAEMLTPGYYAAYQTKQLLDQRNISYIHRIDSAKLAFSLWSTSPIIGAGLGVYISTEDQAGQPARTIHNTALWLLTETGLVGLCLFTVFFLVVMRTCLRARTVENDILAAGVFGVLIMYAGASIGTEVMYQRIPWFLLGLGLIASRPSDSAADKHASPGIAS